ncbi:MAG: acyl carrier protein phosphodiesterase, partial [Leeuwenhoekiella sp.]
QKGILLHRSIDAYTDAHQLVRKSTKRLHPHYHHYSGIIVDIFYDHFLAKNWSSYSDIPLAEYTQRFYAMLKKNWAALTPSIQHMMPYMIKDDWLLSYAEMQGIATVLRNMDRRTKYISGMTSAIEILETDYDAFKSEFIPFFEDLQEHATEKLHSIHKQFDTKNGQ